MPKSILAAVAVALAAAVAACSGGTHSRGQFHGYVVGSTSEQIADKLGKPDSVDDKDPARPRWIYNKRTFDPDNMNKVDEKAIILLEKDAQGRLIGRDVLYG